MRVKGTTAIIALSMAFAANVHAQLPLTPEPSSTPVAEMGGVATIDVITVSKNSLSLPLRHGGLIANSERVEFRGQTLKRGVDYQIDEAAGVIYLMRATKPGDMVRVAYRWDRTKESQKAVGSNFAGLAPFKLDIAPGSRVIFGFGMTERGQNGNTTSSSVMGYQNKFQFGSSGSANGLMLFGQRDKINQQSNYEYEAAAGETETGSSHLILQDLALGLGGGKIEVNYQDISKNFTGFGAAMDSGYAKDSVNQLQKERGLKRFGFSATDVGVGSFKLSSGMRTVGDGKDQIEWKNYGFQSGGFSVAYNSQDVGKDFSRFQDIKEGDREQLRKEAGMNREGLAGQFVSKANKLTFSMNKVEDPNNAAIQRTEVGFSSSKLTFNYGEQEVDQDFRRMGSLMGQEQALWGRELGMKRQWMSLQSSLFGNAAPINYSQSILESAQGSFTAQDIGVKSGGWSLEHVTRSADENFNSFGSMQDAEKKGHVESIGKMYSSAGIAFRGEEVHWLHQSAGISRSLTRISGEPFKGWNLNFDHLGLSGKTDDGFLDSLSLGNQKIKLAYRRQELGENFSEVARLLELERKALGTISGLERTDFSFSAQMSPSRSFLYSSMSADTQNGGASRQQLQYRDPKLSVDVATREVDPAFAGVNQLVDPEKDLLAAMRGFKGTDVKVNWQLASNLKFEMTSTDSASNSLDQTKYMRNYTLGWTPDKNTSVGIRHLEQSNDDPLNVLFAQSIDLFGFTRNMGKMGMIKYSSESQDFDGNQTDLRDWDKQYLGYETKLNPKTTFRAENTATTYEDGGKENVATSTVSTEINPRIGVSVSNVDIDREGGDRDESKRNYGFWYDFGNGMRFVYGYAQHLAGIGALDTENQNMQLSGGNVGNVAVAGGQYTQNQWSDNRTQAMGNIGFATIKPMKFFGFTDLKINASIDTAADRSLWLKENQNFAISGKLGSNLLGYEYKSQVAPNQLRGIDRSVFFTTDQDAKKPLRLNIKYKERHTPFGETILIRDYSVTYRPMKNVEVSHNLLTHPEVAKGDAILGSITTAKKVNRWKLDVKQSADTSFGAQWEEQIDQNRPLTRLGGVNLTLFKKSGSPLSLFYGLEQTDQGGRNTLHRYHLRFDQRPGPNQQFSFFVGNVNTQHGLRDGTKRNALTVQLDYQLRF